MFRMPKDIPRATLAGAVICITISGTLFGASQKSQHQFQQKVQEQKALEPTIDERITGLRGMRENLMAKKELVEKQLQNLEARIEERTQNQTGEPKKEPPHNK
ncbi:hypothetical protein ASPACDRAFT_40899 [Aspergillus aculeatus ATCC 16872]|uniref:Uncharacterized protein n=1 Tax=Aspergillus aculeatus (strain ATCC 16872 / CBS 172.66 / WB 5094) TaxID=690307 RepID=A0A1L9X1R0_ASPA1|nr:uncharacterized protein ASPACDRAFT_40899 [Aspergillus aculeatus ATCC 16872]OJK02078.1 hypothetical protein ASPACDRAFT_40899 [Aspergillus aculeatus ATCC 16872]